jgi:hypothetical protein
MSNASFNSPSFDWIPITQRLVWGKFSGYFPRGRAGTQRRGERKGRERGKRGEEEGEGEGKRAGEWAGEWEKRNAKTQRRKGEKGI